MQAWNSATVKPWSFGNFQNSVVAGFSSTGQSYNFCPGPEALTPHASIIPRASKKIDPSKKSWEKPCCQRGSMRSMRCACPRPSKSYPAQLFRRHQRLPKLQKFRQEISRGTLATRSIHLYIGLPEPCQNPDILHKSQTPSRIKS